MALTRTKSAAEGVPQGSALGPALYKMHTTNVGQNKAAFHLYADDTGVYYTNTAALTFTLEQS